MHHIYKTKAFVLKSWPVKEANKNLVLLTEDLGVLHASVQGARKIESKMRQSIQDYSLIQVALISGRAGWKMINVSFISNFYTDIGSDLSSILIQIFSLIQRLVAGEMEDRNLFILIHEIVNFAVKNSNKLTSEDVKSFEAISISKILLILGYFEEEKAPHYLQNKISTGIIKDLNSSKNISRKKLIIEINKSISESAL